MVHVRAFLALVLLGASTAAAQTKPAAKPAAKQPAQPSPEEQQAAAKAADEARAKAEADARATADAAAAAKAEADARAEAAAREQAAAKQAALEARGLDARVRALASSLALQLKKLPGDHREQSFAVVPFENAGAEVAERSLGVVVTDLVTTDLSRDHRLALVERSQMARVMDELALQQSGAVDDKQALELGKLAGARGLIVGRVADGGSDFLVTARAIDAESGTVLVADEAKLPKAELVAFSADAVVLRSKSGAMFRSVVLPGWGQAYNNEPAKGWLFGAAAGSLAIATIAVGGHALYGSFVEYPNAGQVGESANLADAEKPAFVEALRQRVNTEAVAAQVLAGATAAVWLLNIADAYVSGVDVDNLDAALARR